MWWDGVLKVGDGVVEGWFGVLKVRDGVVEGCVEMVLVIKWCLNNFLTLKQFYYVLCMF